MITSCLECRRRKLKCDKNQPCSGCSKLGRECVYLGPQLDEVSQLRLTALKEKVGSLERQLEQGASRSTQQQSQASQQPQGILADEVADEGDAGDGLRVTDMVAGDVTYEDDGVDDDIVDLGVKVGKMRITDRVGGMSRPRISEEVSAHTHTHTHTHTHPDVSWAFPFSYLHTLHRPASTSKSRKSHLREARISPYGRMYSSGIHPEASSDAQALPENTYVPHRVLRYAID